MFYSALHAGELNLISDPVMAHRPKYQSDIFTRASVGMSLHHRQLKHHRPALVDPDMGVKAALTGRDSSALPTTLFGCSLAICAAGIGFAAGTGCAGDDGALLSLAGTGGVAAPGWKNLLLNMPTPFQPYAPCSLCRDLLFPFLDHCAAGSAFNPAIGFQDGQQVLDRL